MKNKRKIDYFFYHKWISIKILIKMINRILYNLLFILLEDLAKVLKIYLQ